MGKSIILIGVGKYFGEEIIRKFASEGFEIGLIGKSKEKLKLIKDKLKDGIKLNFSVADVTNNSQVEKAISELNSKLGTVNCIIYNVKESVSAEDLDKDTSLLTKAFDTNVRGALNVAKASSKILPKENRKDLIFTGGGFKDKPDSERIALSVSKAGLHNLVLALEPIMKKDNIFVKTIVIDGFVREDSGLKPRQVADYFWEVYNKKEGISFRFPNK